MRKVNFETVSIHEQDKKALREIAKEENRSMGGQIAYWIKQYFTQKQNGFEING